MEDGDRDRDREKRNGHREGRNSGREGAKDHNMELLNNEDLDNEDNEVHQDNNEGLGKFSTPAVLADIYLAMDRL